MKTKLTALAAATAACLFLVSTAGAIDLKGAIGAGTKAVKGATLSDEEVIQYSAEACKALDAQSPIAPAGNAHAERLAKLTRGLENEDGLDLDFKVYIADDVNAFAMPNGCVRFYTGLMDIASDDEIRGVIGHEIGHVKLGHSKAQMKVALLTRAGREGLAASNSSAADLAASELGGLAENVINAQFSQKEESAADEYGYHFMVKHGYDPNALVTLFERLPSSDSLLSSHPSSPKRAKKIKKLIERG